MDENDDDGSVPAPSPEEVMAASTSLSGAWTAKQLRAWGIPWPPPKGWRAELARKHAAGERVRPLEWTDVQAEHMARRKADRTASMEAQQARSKPLPAHAEPEPEPEPEPRQPSDPVAPQATPSPVARHVAPAAAIRVRDTGKPAEPEDPPPWM